MTGQSHLASVLEQISNLAVGIVLATVLSLFLFPAYFGHSVTGSDAITVALIFTVISFFRGLVIRRIWNWGMLYWKK
jgi:hypothetical protein